METHRPFLVSRHPHSGDADQTGTSGRSDERLEWSEVLWVPPIHELWMPLDTDEERGGRMDDCFDDAVACPSHRDKRLREATDGLVVERIDPQTRPVEEGPDRGVRGDGHLVTDGVGGETGFLLAVEKAWAELRWHVLDEGTAENHIDDLDAAADAEDWEVGRSRRSDEVKLELITIVVDAVGRGVDLMLAIARWIDIRSACEEQSVNHAEQARDVVRLWGKDDGNAAGGLDGRSVGLVEGVAEELSVRLAVSGRARRQADHGLHLEEDLLLGAVVAAVIIGNDDDGGAAPQGSLTGSQAGRTLRSTRSSRACRCSDRDPGSDPTGVP